MSVPAGPKSDAGAAVRHRPAAGGAVPALVLRVHPYSETSQVLRVLTPHGVVGVLAKGARRPRNQLHGPHDRLTLLEVELRLPRRGGDGLALLRAARQTAWFPALRASPEGFAAAEVVLEVLLLAPVAEPDAPEVLSLALRVLGRLEAGEDPLPVLATLLAGILRVYGLAPDVRRCVLTGREASGRYSVAFSYIEGGLLAPSVAVGAPDTVMLSPAGLRALQELLPDDRHPAEPSPDGVSRTLPDERQAVRRGGMAEALRVMAGLFERAAGRRLHSLPFFSAAVGATGRLRGGATSRLHG